MLDCDQSRLQSELHVVYDQGKATIRVRGRSGLGYV